jgi:flagellin FlaB
MTSKLKGLLRGERGITGLETAIILIAFVVVAAVFAFTVLSAGVFSAERGKEAVHAGLEEVRGSMELRGSVIAEGDTTNNDVDAIIFTVANVAGGQPIDLTQPTDANADGIPDSGSNHKVVISYRDENQHDEDLAWSMTWRGSNDGDVLLEEGELAQITVDLTPTGLITPALSTNTTFILEVKPPQGGILVIERTTPAKIDAVMDLQ